MLQGSLFVTYTCDVMSSKVFFLVTHILRYTYKIEPEYSKK